MKKFICLALSLMMVMSLVTVPVMADEVVDETTTTSTQPLPDMWFTAATVNDSVSTEITDYTVKVGGFGTTWYPAYDEGTEQSKQVRVHNKAAALRTDADGNPLKWIPTEAWLGKTAVNAEEWEGFRVDATSVSAIANFDKGIGANGAGIVFSTSGTDANAANNPYAGAQVRADSIRFKMPEATGEETNKAMTVLFGYSNTGYFNTDTIGGSKGTLRLYDGGAYVKDLSAGSDAYYNFLPEGTTVSANKWYRAERILDTRIDKGVVEGTTTSAEGTENWQRYIIYDDATNAIVGDSGWVMTGTVSKETTAIASYKDKPFNNMGFSAYNYPEGSYVYFDDIKSWAISAPASDYEVGDLAAKPKYLEFPIANEAGTARKAWSLSLSTYSDIYYATGVGLNDATGGRARAMAYNENKYTSDYIYMQTDFMIPEANTREFGLLDLTREAATAGQRGGDQTPSGVVKVKDGVLTVHEWNPALTNSNKYGDAVKLADGSDFAITLEPGKWYTAQLKIDQSVYVDQGLFAYPYQSGSANNSYTGIVKVVDGVETQVRLTDADTTTAQVVISDGENTYTTEEFTYRSPHSYSNYGTWNRMYLADIRMPGGSTTGNYSQAVTGVKINLDNVKIALSNSTIDEPTCVVYDEDFEEQTLGQNFTEFMFDQFNPKNASAVTNYTNGLVANNLAAVAVDKVNCDGIPTSARLTLGEDINAATVAETVTLYQGETEVKELLTGASYNADTNVLTVNFGALEPETSYTISIDRAATEMEGNIFSVLPGDNGKTAEFSFTTGYMISDKLRFTPKFTYPMLGVGLEDMGGVYPYEIASSESTLKSYNEGSTAYVVVAAIYDANGKMEDIMAQTGTIEPGEPIPVDFGGDTILPVNGTTLKAFVWNTWSQMKPIGDIYVYPVAE